VVEQLLNHLEEGGCKGKVVPVQHLYDLQAEIEGHYREGRIDQDVYQEHLAVFNFSLPGSLPETRSLIVVAIPQPPVRVTFAWDGQPVPLVAPPTYLHWRKTDRRVEGLLMEVLGPQGYRVAPAIVPKKLLAVRSGLAAYGKNNICYVPGMGSFLGLTVYFSDLPCPDDPWREPHMMEACQKCSACLRNCPVGAITTERFLLHAERCITFHSERANEIPYPSWIDPSWLDCLVGCMRCQRICPQNKDVREWVEDGVAFTPEEAALLLQGVPLAQLPAATVEKLEQGDLVGLLDVMPRNLGVFLWLHKLNP